MFNHILHQQLQSKRWYLALHRLSRYPAIAVDAVTQTHFVQKQVRIHELQFLTQWDQILVLTLQHISIHIRQMPGKAYGIVGVVFYFGNQRIQAIKQEMGIQLALQSSIFGLRILYS